MIRQLMNACNTVEEFIDYYKEKNGESVRKWRNSLKEIEREYKAVKKDHCSIRDEKEKKLSILNQLIINVGKIIDEFDLKNKERQMQDFIQGMNNRYNTIDGIKENFINSIDVLSFDELIDYNKDLMTNITNLKNEKDDSTSKDCKTIYKKYIKTFTHCSIIVKDRLNSLNRNKTKNQYIDYAEFEKAMCFVYDKDSLEEAIKERKRLLYSKNRELGNKGERDVEYALGWLDKVYKSITRKSINKSDGKASIYLINEEFTPEPQEYDHLIVCSKGVIVIETKNWQGKIIVDSNGNWRRNKDGKEEGITNPLQQIRQHEKVLKSFLPNECPIINIICIASDKAILEGVEYSKIPIVKKDAIVDYIEEYQSDVALSDEEISEIEKLIYDHMI